MSQYVYPAGPHPVDSCLAGVLVNLVVTAFESLMVSNKCCSTDPSKGLGFIQSHGLTRDASILARQSEAPPVSVGHRCCNFPKSRVLVDLRPSQYIMYFILKFHT